MGLIRSFLLDVRCRLFGPPRPPEPERGLWFPDLDVAWGRFAWPDGSYLYYAGASGRWVVYYGAGRGGASCATFAEAVESLTARGLGPASARPEAS